MQRRRLLKAVAAGGLTSIATSTTGGARRTGSQRIDELDALHVKRDGEIVRTVENPTVRDLKRMESLLRADEGLITNIEEDECATYCQEDCDVACSGKSCWSNCSCLECLHCC